MLINKIGKKKQEIIHTAFFEDATVVVFAGSTGFEPSGIENRMIGASRQL
jgi:hypothetical protein